MTIWFQIQAKHVSRFDANTDTTQHFARLCKNSLPGINLRSARRGLPSAHDRPSGAAGGASNYARARSAEMARRPVWCRRLDAQIVPPCAFRPARWLAKPQGMAGDRIDSRTLILGRGAAAPARRNPRDQEKERYLAHSNAKTARWRLAGIFPEKMSSPQLERVCVDRSGYTYRPPRLFLPHESAGAAAQGQNGTSGKKLRG